MKFNPHRSGWRIPALLCLSIALFFAVILTFSSLDLQTSRAEDKTSSDNASHARRPENRSSGTTGFERTQIPETDSIQESETTTNAVSPAANPNISPVDVNLDQEDSNTAWGSSLPKTDPVWQKAELLNETITVDSKVPPEEIRRIRLLYQENSLSLKYLRVEETFALSNGEETASLTPTERIEMLGNRILVQMEDESRRTELAQTVHKLGGVIARKITDYGLYEISFNEPEINTVPEAVDAVQKLAGIVEFAEPDYVQHLFQTPTLPNDPLFEKLEDGYIQWSLDNPGGFNSSTNCEAVADSDIDAPEGWTILNQASDIIVAVIDSGVQHSHEDLYYNMWKNPGESGFTQDGKNRQNNGIDDDANGFVDDVFGINVIDGSGYPVDDVGHGTHVAGILGAVGNNATGLTGVAWRVKIMALKFLDSEGGTTSGAIECINYAINHDAHILNNSWGGGVCSQALKDAVQLAQNADILFVGAAGNSSQDVDTLPATPADLDADGVLENVIVVAASDTNDQLAWFSNFASQGKNVDVAAPGVFVYSTWIGESNKEYEYLDGSSMAAPVVSGMLALLKTHYPTENYASLKNRILYTVDTLPGLQNRVATNGRVNLYRALTIADPMALPRITAELQDVILEPGEDAGFSVEATGDEPFFYSWYLNDVLLKEIEDSSLELHNLQPGDDATIKVVVRNAAGEASSRASLLVSSSNASLREALETTPGAISFEDSGDASWKTIADDVVSGLDSVTNDLIADGQKTRLEASYAGPGILTFFYKVSTEENFDFLNFYIDGVLISRASGNIDWRKATVPIAAGSHTVVWEYAKDESGKAGEDRVWIDQIEFEAVSFNRAVIISQPQSIITAPGESITFKAEARGSEPLAYQWYRDGSPLTDIDNRLEGTDSNELSIQTAGQADTGSYTLVVSNEDDSGNTYTATTRPVKLVLTNTIKPPVILQQPLSQEINAGSKVKFSVWATGIAPLRYQWYKGNIPIAGANASSLYFESAAKEDAGSYRVEISNSGGIISSNIVRLVIREALLTPRIVKEPQSTAGRRGGEAAFLVIARGAGPLSYQWFKDGIPLDGADDNILILENLTLTDAGSYQVAVMNRFGVEMSRQVRLAVLNSLNALMPALDFRGFEWWTTNNGWVIDTGELHQLYLFSLTNQPGQANGETSLISTRIYGPGTLTLYARTSTEEFHDILYLTLNDEIVHQMSGEQDWEMITVDIPEGWQTISASYAKDASGSAGQDAVWITDLVYSPDASAIKPVSISSQPRNMGVYSGGTAIFEVAAIGSFPISYQWQYYNEATQQWEDLSDGGNISGSHTSTMTLEQCAEEDARKYRVVTSNRIFLSNFTEVSDEIKLSVYPADLVEALAVFTKSNRVRTYASNWNTHGNCCAFGWGPTVTESYEGSEFIDVLKSGPVGNNESSHLSVDIEGPAILRFYWRVSSEGGHDYVRFYVDDELAGEASGETDWTEKVFSVGAGIHSLEWVYIKDGAGASGEDAAYVADLDILENVDTINEALDTDGYEPQLPWTLAGDAPWQSVIEDPGDSGDPDYMSSGLIGNNQSSTLSVTWDFSVATVLSFLWKVSSEENYDWLVFEIDGIRQKQISGEKIWTREYYPLSMGSHTLTWTYTKNYELSGGQDQGWLNDVALATIDNSSDVVNTALNTDGLTWYTTGQADWAATGTDEAHDGISALRSGAVDDLHSSRLITAINGPGTMSFWWKVDSEEDSDYLGLVIDDTLYGSISGNADWQQEIVTIPAGNHVLRWIYLKDATGSSGEDAGWLDELSFVSADYSDDYNTALETPASLSWNVDGQAFWSLQTTETWDGVDALQSGTVDTGQYSALGTAIDGPGNLSFYWRSDTLENANYLTFHLDGRIIAGISGSSDWDRQRVSIPEGTHTANWIYSNNRSGGAASEMVWLDHLYFNKAPEFISDPVTTVAAGDNYSYTIQVEDANSGESIDITVLKAPPWLHLENSADRSAVLTGTPPELSVGRYLIYLQASDEGGNKVRQEFYLTVSGTGQTAFNVSYFTNDDLADNTLETLVWGDLANPDNDGLPNILEYAFGRDPIQPDAGVLYRMVTVSDDSGNTELFLVFNWDSRISDLSYTIDYSPSLAPDSWVTVNWVQDSLNSLPAGETGTTDTTVIFPGNIDTTFPVMETIVLRITDPIPTDQPAFFRLKVVSANGG